MLNKEESQLKKGSDASWVDVVSRVLKEEVGFKSHVEDESIAICMGKDYFHGSNRTVMEEFKSMGEHEILGGGFNKASLVGELRLIDYLSFCRISFLLGPKLFEEKEEEEDFEKFTLCSVAFLEFVEDILHYFVKFSGAKHNEFMSKVV
ncbi:hypothetical protein V6N12_066933 [Hibiscus sabdariffa]|uniref:Uncharacterized protein n=1 Tax=Hibiscus sabdariffa TaxID=183260 RepID=A0ABR2AX39_9ROSI